MTAYYNEFDPNAAEWLRNLIAAGLIAPGVVDTRSIEDVHPSDVRGFTQCHFFAGIGVWSLALRRAGWSDDRPVWTGSCPCQPFSAAGEGAGFADERHLWPAFHHLIRECGPAIVLGEQVASRDADPWIDLVHTDMEALGYGFGAVPFPSAGVGAPHIRDRLYWMADADNARLQGRKRSGTAGAQGASGRHAAQRGRTGGLGDADYARLEGYAGDGRAAGRQGPERSVAAPGVSGGLADAADIGQYGRRAGQASDGRDSARVEFERLCDAGIEQPGPTNGYWRAADWLACRDGKWRPVEPGTFPLAHGAAGRVGRLRAYGNAINAQAAQVWIEAVMVSLESNRPAIEDAA